MTPPRLAYLRRLARERDLTHVLVTDPVDCEYASGFHASSVSLLVSSRKALLFTDFRYRVAARAFSRKSRVWRFVETRDHGFRFLAGHVSHGSRVGFQSNAVTVDQFRQLRKVLKGVRLIPLGKRVSEAGIVKLPLEIRAMGRAAAAGCRAFSVFVERLKLGMTECDAARLLEDLCKAEGSTGPAFDTIVLFGRRAALPHGTPSSRGLKRGDWVLCDFGCTIDGFCSDMTRTLVAGRAGQRQRQIYETVRRAQSRGRAKVRAGLRASEVDETTRGVIDSAGFGDAFGHATGHGVGRRIHEEPRLSKSDDTILRENMVVTVEPGIYLPAEGGVRIEDMVLVTREGRRCLTTSPRNLVEAGV